MIPAKLDIVIGLSKNIDNLEEKFITLGERLAKSESKTDRNM